MSDNRPCERHCPGCNEWKHHSRFRNWCRGGSTSTRVFARLCRDCEQRQKNEQKNEDRARWLIEGRAAAHARAAGSTKQFFMVTMNYRSLVPYLRAMMSPEGLCHCCGHSFDDEKDIQIEHREPKRHAQDWARLHARNLGLTCQSCNGTKLDKPYALWLDEQEQCRLSNEQAPTVTAQASAQLELFP